MKVLALEPYYGGSHRAFLDGWARRSRHDWTILGLPAYKWKWRMRHSAIHFAEEVRNRDAQGERWDFLFCSDMLNLAEFLGLVPETIRSLASVVYFHENQLTYPTRHASDRDYQFAMINLTTALAATRVWFNSRFHRNSFLGALEDFLRKMPDHQPVDAIGQIRANSDIRYPGIEDFPTRSVRKPGPIRILWAARWEHDKNPEDFFRSLDGLEDGGVPFRLSVIGERFRDSPKIFSKARERFAARIDRWGYQEDRKDFENALLECDVFVSTAKHEFFGLGVVEAAAAGAFLLLPDRLSYPELFPRNQDPRFDRFFFDGEETGLKAALARLAGGDFSEKRLWDGEPNLGIEAVKRFHWNQLIPEMDEALDSLKC